MSGKTLSTGTLSLRFMQNAHRAKQLAEVEAEQAKVTDEAEWEVAKEVKDAWKIGSGSSAVQSISYETSYMPFLFDRDVINPKGRRTFDKRGHEVDEVEAENETQPQANLPAPADMSKGSKRPISISGPLSAVHKSSTKDAKKMNDTSKTAKQMIRDSSGVGIDLHAIPSSARLQKTSLESTFLKPSGVDEPADSTKGSTNWVRDNEIFSGTRPKAKGLMKRAREAPSEPKEEGKKRKKKKIVE